MKVIVLGTAAGGGFPQWNCRCPNCEMAWAGDVRAPWRSQASIAVSADGEEWILVDASPDLGQQLRATPQFRPRRLRHSPITTVVLTSAEIDHVAGLLSLRESADVDVIAMPKVLEALSDNPVFSMFGDRAKPVSAGSAFAAGGLRLTLFPVPGKAALYREGPDPDLASEEGDTAGLLVEEGNASILYVPGCAAVSPMVASEAARASIVLFDGTLFTDDEMITLGAGAKTGRRMGHMPITGEGGSLAFLSGLSARRIYTHINNTNPILIAGSPERREVEAAGVEIAHDGLELIL